MAPLDPALIAEEDALWRDLRTTIDAFTPSQALMPGYFPEGWSAKDALAHIGTWLAEGGMALEQIRVGTYVELRSDQLDEMNARFLDAMRDVPLDVIRAQAAAARARMLRVWTEMPSPGEIVDEWIRKSGPSHYREHLPRLHEWLREVKEASAREP